MSIKSQHQACGEFGPNDRFSISIKYANGAERTMVHEDQLADEQEGLDRLAYEADMYEQSFEQGGVADSAVLSLCLNGNYTISTVALTFKPATGILRRDKYDRIDREGYHVLPKTRPTFPKKERA